MGVLGYAGVLGYVHAPGYTVVAKRARKTGKKITVDICYRVLTKDIFRTHSSDSLS